MKNNFSTHIIESDHIAMTIEYDGADYFGWQIQKKPAMPSVQEVLEQALSKVANEPIRVFCAGRTDSGVHASGQMVHFTSQTKRSEKSWIMGANVNMPKNVVVKSVSAVPANFHARFSATARTYRYVILNANVRSAILTNKVVQIAEDLDVNAMQKAANYLLGEHDFSAYRGAGCQSHTANRFVKVVRIYREGQFIITEITANAFLLHMVRNIMGVLIEIGLGKQSSIWAQELLIGQDRKKAARTAPPFGLYLVKAHYPSEFALPELPLGPAFLQP